MKSGMSVALSTAKLQFLIRALIHSSLTELSPVDDKNSLNGAVLFVTAFKNRILCSPKIDYDQCKIDI